jgi:hypothetical protein
MLIGIFVEEGTQIISVKAWDHLKNYWWNRLITGVMDVKAITCTTIHTVEVGGIIILISRGAIQGSKG